MTKFLKCLLSALISITVTVFPLFCASAEALAENEEHGLALTIPEDYILLNSETAEDNIELIESLGYSLSSFKNYLKDERLYPHRYFWV